MTAAEFGKKMLLNLKILPVMRDSVIPVGLPFITMFNPESFSISETVEYDQPCTNGVQGEGAKFIKSRARTFSLEFTLDGTGTNAPKIPLIVQIALFREATTLMNGLIHKPNYLIVQWGTFICKCQMKTSDIQYTLFDQTGIPLRAKIKATFEEFTNDKLSQILGMLSSPDLTHVHKVVEGEILSIIVFNTYNDQRYYIQVAKVNRLKNFRKLKAGTLLTLPPIAKQ
ncbi:CIS tube protein [Dyadobacter arcticus]|uniref:Contractile injection system tube protein N-terminal domain-containing protein n=1 Tax=Dyadobacter arcticus TaxID=1078754 RepID=A0ABX0UPB7_9BACT|nr:hypothetical protein [Dyadobacter arcticus]NIJ54702.1 hypothetical protein [Dyadobacter arcticus]